MRYEDRITISTPEGLTLELTLAGAGSRLVAAIIDAIIAWLTTIALFVVVVVPFQSGPALAVFTVLAFVLNFGYHAIFETFWSGRTPGKRLVGTRVVREGGSPITFRDAMTRTVLLIVDGPLTANLGGLIAILASKRNQRLGDMAAGTIVVRERTIDLPADNVWVNPDEVAGWDVMAISDSDVATIRRFLERRSTLDADVRSRLAADLARRLRPRVAGAPEDGAPEHFLELLVAAKSSRM